jgi:hypothetical protein
MYPSYLVGGCPTPLKNMSSSVGVTIPNIWNNIKCLKPPARSYERLQLKTGAFGGLGAKSSVMFGGLDPQSNSRDTCYTRLSKGPPVTLAMMHRFVGSIGIYTI